VTPARSRRGKRKAGAAGLGTVLLAVALYVLLGPGAFTGTPNGAGGAPPATDRASVAGVGLDPALRSAIADERSGVMVTLDAEVVKNLPDDNEGSRHQRLLLALDKPVGGVETILIAHNIDLAERVPCAEGDRVLVRGQYEWNDKGGVIHWTHHDPGRRREGGWIEHEGERYE
jgi:hypothetical protein